MLTKDLIQQQDSLAHLTNEDIKVIETLSQNDEKEVIHRKRGEFYTEFDQAVLESTGIKKNAGEKASDYHKRAAKELKDAANGGSDSLADIEAKDAKIKELEKQITDGTGSESMKKKLSDLESEISSLKAAHSLAIEAKDKMISDKDTEVVGQRLDAEFASSIAKIKLKSDDIIDAKVKAAFLKEAKAELLAEYTMDTDDGKLVWRDKDGNIVRNPKNGNNPMTTDELISPKLTPIMDEARKAEGTGGKAPSGNQRSSSVIRAKTQVEFTEQATDALIAQGVQRGTSEFTTKMTDLRTEHNASKLPMQ